MNVAPLQGERHGFAVPVLCMTGAPLQHITFTMPHLLWPFFSNNWPLLNNLFRCATCALHTYGRQLNQPPHIHVSVTRGGLDVMHGIWRRLFFKKKAVEEIWRSAVIRLLRDSYAQIMPGILPGLGHIRDERQWRRYLQAQYGRYWKGHCCKVIDELAFRVIERSYLSKTLLTRRISPRGCPK
nr:transposase [Candidatus Erwinia dacicola]